MLAERNAQIGRAVAVLKELSEDERTRMLEESYQKKQWDDELRMEAAFAEGERSGQQKGEQAGEQKGMRKVALKLLRADMPIQTVALMTELPVAEVEHLRADLDMQTEKE